MSTKHTPGPWTKADRLNGPWWHIAGPQTATGRQAVACVHGESKRGAKAYAEMFEANARLIAAAPDLLDALRNTASMLRSACLAITDTEARQMALETVAEANTAIAKATGEKA